MSELSVVAQHTLLDDTNVVIFGVAAGVRGVCAAGVELTGLQRHVVPEDGAEAGEEEEPGHGGGHPVTEILEPESGEAAVI